MPIDKRNISISFGQGIDTRTDPNQVMPGKLIALYDATLSSNLQLNKRNGYQPLSIFNTAVASSTLTNQKLAVFNNQLLVFDGKACQSISNGSTQFIDNFIAAQPSISTIAREAIPIVNQDAAYNSQFNNTAYIWSSSCVAPNFQQLGFSGATGKFEILSANGSVLASTGIFGFVKNRVFSFGNNFYWTGINYASSTLQYYQVPANATSAYFNPANTIGTGAVGGDFPANTLQTGYNRYQRYDGAVLNNNLYIGWFQPATSAVNIHCITQSGVTVSNSIKANASGALGVFGDNNYVWLVYHDGATSAGFAVFNTSALTNISGPNNWFTSDGSTPTNLVSIPQLFTGTSKSLAANIYAQNINYYPPLQINASCATAWPGPFRTDFIWKQSLNGNTGATSGSSAVVIRGMGLGSKAFNSLGDDYFLASYGGTQTATSADRLEPTDFLIAATKNTNNIVAKLAFTNGSGYDLKTGGQAFFQNNNYGSVGYGLPLPLPFSTPTNPLSYTVPYLLKTEAIPLSSTSLNQPFFISQNFGVNSCSFNFNAPALYSAAPYGNNLNIASGYLAAFDGKMINEQNFHLFPEDVLIVGSSTNGPPANTYSYQLLYEYQDTQGNIFRSAPSKVYNFTTLGSSATASSAMYMSIPTLRATNKTGIKIRVFRNAPTIDPLTFHDTAPLNPVLNNPSVDNVSFVDTLTDAQLIGNPVIYTSGNVVENTGVPSPLYTTIYKLRVMALDAEQNVWWFSKEVLPGTTVEFSDLQTFSVSNKFGNSTCGIEMGDKFIIFTRSSDGSLGAIYYMTGEGPSPDGSNNDFSLPILISSTLTTNNPNSLVLTPEGLMFQSDKGIWILGYNLSTQYIGADVQAFNSNVVTSATVIPGTTEVRFTLDSGVALVWDFYQKQWSVYSNIRATHGLIYQGLFTYLNQNQSQAYLLQETLGQYVDINRPVLMSLTLGWLSLSGLQGYQRAQKLFVLGQSQSPHLLNVSIAYDFNPSAVQTAIIKPLPSANGSWGSDPFWGSAFSWGSYQKLEQFRINLTRQKCQSVQISIQETLDPTNIVYGAGPVLEALGIVIGGKLSYPKLPAIQSVK